MAKRIHAVRLSFVRVEPSRNEGSLPSTSFTFVIYDTARYTMEWAKYGPKFEEESQMFKELGYFIIAQDRKYDGGFSYCLKRLA